MQRFRKNLIAAIAIVVIPLSITVLVIFYIENKKSDKKYNTVIDNEYTSSIRDSIKNDSIVIDSIIKEKDNLKNEYDKKTDSIIVLSDSASVCFFREYIRLYKNGLGEDKHQ